MQRFLWEIGACAACFGAGVGLHSFVIREAQWEFAAAKAALRADAAAVHARVSKWRDAAAAGAQHEFDAVLAKLRKWI